MRVTAASSSPASISNRASAASITARSFGRELPAVRICLSTVSPELTGGASARNVGAFAGYFIAPTYLPAQYPTCGPGTAYLYILGVNDARGFFPDPSAPPSEDRRMTVGTGIPSKARVSAGVKASDDKIYIQTSEGEVWTLQPPARDAGLNMIYWRQRI